MTLLAHHAASTASSAPAMPLARDADALDMAQRAAAGPGWYESSWELLSGLEVCESPVTEAGAGDAQS